MGGFLPLVNSDPILQQPPHAFANVCTDVGQPSGFFALCRTVEAHLIQGFNRDSILKLLALRFKSMRKLQKPFKSSAFARMCKTPCTQQLQVWKKTKVVHLVQLDPVCVIQIESLLFVNVDISVSCQVHWWAVLASDCMFQSTGHLSLHRVNDILVYFWY